MQHQKNRELLLPAEPPPGSLALRLIQGQLQLYLITENHPAEALLEEHQLLVQRPLSHFLGLHAPADQQRLHPLQRAALRQFLDRHIDLHRVERLLVTHVRLAQNRQPPAEPVLSIKQVQLWELIEACNRSTRQKTPMRQKRLPDVSTNISA